MENLKRIKIKGHEKLSTFFAFASSGTKWNDISDKVINLC